MKLVQVVDSLEYVETNCYQHMLLADLKRRYDHTVVPLAELESLKSLDLGAVVLSTVKIRNVYANLERFRTALGDRKVYVYDQDPWESFIDTATYPGGYAKTKSALSGAEFIVTSGWWASYVRSKGLPARFCRVWMLPEYCSVGLPSADRVPGLSFKGKLHGFRETGIDALSAVGVNVDVSSSVRYGEWLEWLRTRQAFFHDESNDWDIDWAPVSKQCAVLKDVEVASQGCFVFRDDRSAEEIVNYGADKLPCVLTFSSYADCADKLRWLQQLPLEQRDQMISETVEAVKNVGGWIDMARILEAGE